MRSRFLLLFFSTAGSLMLCEVVLRLLGLSGYSLERRVLFYTFPAWVMDAHQAIRYRANTAIRTVAVYGSHIDYDVVSTTNNWGLFDDQDYQKPKSQFKDIAFVGDSFTAGSGGDAPWVIRLRQLHNSKDDKLYNLGVGGTGFHHFFRLLESLAQDGVTFDEINIVVISNDFTRPFWYPHYQKNRLWFCIEAFTAEECLQKRRPIVHGIRHDETSAEIVDKATEIYKVNAAPLTKNLAIYERTHLYNLACDIHISYRMDRYFSMKCPHRKRYVSLHLKKGSRYAASLDALQETVQAFPKARIRLFQIPEKQETYSGKYELDISADIFSLGIEYVSLLDVCRWNIGMYHRHDTHPNNYGYENLAKCIAKHMD